MFFVLYACVLLSLAVALPHGEAEGSEDFVESVKFHEDLYLKAREPSEDTPKLSVKKRQIIVNNLAEKYARLPLEDVTEVKFTTGKYQYALSQERFIQDDVISPEDCKRVIRAVNASIQAKNERHDFSYDAFKEVFNGISLGELFSSAESTREDRQILLYARESARFSAQRYFNLSALYVDYTHFTRRNVRPEDAPEKWEHKQGLAHGIHADNCQHREGGSCVKLQEHCCHWRDLSSILYLNGPDEFTDQPDFAGYQGGDIFFEDSRIGSPDEYTRTMVTPKCGRLVAFTAGRENTHGVTNIEGQGFRFALPNWLTVNPNNDEEVRMFVDDDDWNEVLRMRHERLEYERQQELKDEL